MTVIDYGTWSGKQMPDVQLEPELRDDSKHRVVRMRNIRECPVDYLWKRKVLSDEQRAGIDRFRRDWELGQIGSLSCPDPERLPIGKDGVYQGLSDHRLDAIGRVNRIMSRLSPVARKLLDLIGVRRVWLKDAAKIVGYPQDYVGLRFREAIGELLSHYEDIDQDKIKDRRFGRLTPGTEQDKTVMLARDVLAP